MCGIMGYVGPRPATPILLDGLQRLEYRGYDSAGVAVLEDGVIAVDKSEGKLSRLIDKLDGTSVAGTLGIGHTRWATHGAPSDANAHPHCDPSGEFVVVHNGIIENFLPLKEELTGRGHHFSSETDTEILAHLIADEYDGDLVTAVRNAVAKARGAYALVVMTSKEPDRIVAVRMVSPLVVGLGDGENFLASDIPAVLHHTRDFLIIEDGELVEVTRDGVFLQKLDGTPIQREPLHVDWDAGRAERGGYEHFMLKEIFEQPDALTDTLIGRLGADGALNLEDVRFGDDFVAGINRVWITACGTAFHAGLVGKDVIEKLARIPVEAVYAHELRYRDPLIAPGDLCIAISQSGETADTIAAARLAKERGARLLAVTNVVGSTLAREADDILYTRAGPEIAVASTKAYITMLVADYLLGLKLARGRELMGGTEARRIESELTTLPGKAELVLKHSDTIADLGKHLAAAQDIYFIGRGLDYAAAMEGSLKLKEISYIHSEAMPAGELKHGTLALVTEGTPVICVITQTHVYDKTISAVKEVQARGGHVIAIAYDDDAEIGKYADHVLRIPRIDDLLAPVLATIPLQLLAYYVALEKGHDIDQPRNLAKSVTVE